MFTRTLRVAALAAVILTLAGGAVAQEAAIRIAVVDLDRLVAQSAAGQALQAKLTQFERDVQREGTAMADKVKATRQLIADGANSLSEERLSELQKQLEDEMIAVDRFTKDKQRQGQKMQQEGLRDIENRLQPILEQVQTEGNYDLILNKALGVVVMASDRVDITGRVIAMLDAAEAAGSTG